MDKRYQEELIYLDSQYKNLNVDLKDVYCSDIRNFITGKHIDVILKYLYVKAYVEGDNYEYYKYWYEQMQSKRVNKTYYIEFNNIIESFKKYGFIKKYAIPINKYGEMLNGSHRLACCLYFNINPYVYHLDNPTHSYDIQWFIENDFDDVILKTVEDTKNELLARYQEKTIKLKNMYAAMISPISNGYLNKEMFLNHSKMLINNGIKGLFLCGNTGNGMNLDVEMKKEIITLATKKIENISIIVHVGSQNIKDIYNLIEYINKIKVDAIACMPPYNTINNYESVKQFYENVAKESKHPVIIYHIPTITKIDFSSEQLHELLQINNVVGIKYTDSNLERLLNLSKRDPEKYLFFGRDDLLMEGLQNGADAGIGGCYNLFPRFVYNIMVNFPSSVSEEYQKKLNFCIQKLRGKYPDIPGYEFVEKSLNIKDDMDDEEFYQFLKNNEFF